MQRTLRRLFEIKGTGLHSGERAIVRVLPAPAGYGIWLRRVDITDRDNLIPALYDHVNDTQLCTRVANNAGVEVSTVEHLVAALAGTGVHNAVIEVDGPEIPIMDGSSAPFVAAILKSGLEEQVAPLRAIRILKDVHIAMEGFCASLSPADGIEIGFEIDYNEPAIGQQSKFLKMSNGAFVRELSNCRTFCRRKDVDTMWSAGLALGGSLENAIVVDGTSVLNPEGFRRADECVRHKMLDAVGDLALAGNPIIGRYHGKFAGHRANNLLLRELFADPEAWEMIDVTPTQWNDLPGAHIKATDFVHA